tara:strand:+ start:6647 stop:7414 length:768 start_codon:yes stop_codon:yes gene_type:complete
VLGFSTKQWAILITAVIHTVFIMWFAYIRVDFDPDNTLNRIRMSFAEEEVPEIEEAKEEWIPKDYQEHGLDQKKQSVAQTNQAVNEATNELSKGEQERLEREIEAQVNQMAKEASTTGHIEAGSEGSLSGNLSVSKEKKKKVEKKSGTKKGKEDLGNVHDKSTNITYFLKDRTLGAIGLYNPVYLCEEGGIVVINIVVNTFGDVISASVNNGKSNTGNECLRSAAKQAALKSSFNENQQAASRQKGIITYKFMAQ